jgi:hypothetical protein
MTANNQREQLLERTTKTPQTLLEQGKDKLPQKPQNLILIQSLVEPLPQTSHQVSLQAPSECRPLSPWEQLSQLQQSPSQIPHSQPPCHLLALPKIATRDNSDAGEVYQHANISISQPEMVSTLSQSRGKAS